MWFPLKIVTAEHVLLSYSLCWCLLLTVPLEMGRLQSRSRTVLNNVAEEPVSLSSSPELRKRTIRHIPLADRGWEQFSFLRRRPIHSALDKMNLDTAKHNHSNQSELRWINKKLFKLEFYHNKLVVFDRLPFLLDDKRNKLKMVSKITTHRWIKFMNEKIFFVRWNILTSHLPWCLAEHRCLALLKKRVLSLSRSNSRRLIWKALVLIKGDEVGSFSVALLRGKFGWPFTSSVRACASCSKHFKKLNFDCRLQKKASYITLQTITCVIVSNFSDYSCHSHVNKFQRATNKLAGTNIQQQKQVETELTWSRIVFLFLVSVTADSCMSPIFFIFSSMSIFCSSFLSSARSRRTVSSLWCCRATAVAHAEWMAVIQFSSSVWLQVCASTNGKGQRLYNKPASWH